MTRKVLCAAVLVAVSCVAQPRSAPALNLRPNEVAGVDVDRFMGYPANKTAHISHGGLLTHSILRAGNRLLRLCTHA